MEMIIMNFTKKQQQNLLKKIVNDIQKKQYNYAVQNGKYYYQLIYSAGVML